MATAAAATAAATSAAAGSAMETVTTTPNALRMARTVDATTARGPHLIQAMTAALRLG